MTFRGVIIAATCVAAACGGKQQAKPTPVENRTTSEAPASGGMSVDEAGVMMTALMEEIGTAVTSADGDCARMGANLKVLTGKVAAAMAIGEEFDKDEAKRTEFDTKYSNALLKQMEGWIPAVQKCRDDAEVKAFFEAIL